MLQAVDDDTWALATHTGINTQMLSKEGVKDSESEGCDNHAAESVWMVWRRITLEIVQIYADYVLYS